jgi:hypothetical protein
MPEMGVMPPSSTVGCTTSGPNTGDQVTVTIRYPFSIGLPPIFGAAPFRYSGNLVTSATERLE